MKWEKGDRLISAKAYNILSFTAEELIRRGSESELLLWNDGWMLHIGGGQGEPEDQRGDREAAAEGQERLPP